MYKYPHYLIIGAQKSGTTSLHTYLDMHPLVALPMEKEVHYFDLNYDKGDEWYLEKFNSLKLKGGQVCGESSPYYIFHPLVPPRVEEFKSDIKLILLLREPASRAVSNYFHALRMGFESMSFEDALKVEGERLKGEDIKILRDPTYFSYSHQHHSYISRGFYALQIKHWLKYFQREQMLILSSEELFKNTQLCYDRVTEFLGISKFNLANIEVFNEGSTDNDVESKINHLKPFYTRANEELFELIGEDFGWNQH